MISYICCGNFSAQQKGLLCEEAGTYLDNVKYCGYCTYHYKKLVRLIPCQCNIVYLVKRIGKLLPVVQIAS